MSRRKFVMVIVTLLNTPKKGFFSEHKIYMYSKMYKLCIKTIFFIISLGLITIWFSFALNAPVFRFIVFFNYYFPVPIKSLRLSPFTVFPLYVCYFVFFYKCSVFLSTCRSVFPP